MAAPSVRAVGTAYNTAANAAATPSFTGGTMPTHATGDLLVMFVTIDAGASTTSTLTGPTGWVELTDLAWGTPSTILYGRAYAKVAASSGETFTAPTGSGLTTGNSGGGGGIRVVSLQDVDTSAFPGTPASVITNGGTELTPSATTSTTGIGAISGFTPSMAATLIVVWGGHAATSAANTNVLSGDSLTWTEQFDDNYTGGADHMSVLDTAPETAAAAVTNKTFTFAAAHTAGRFGGRMVAFKAAPKTTPTARISLASGDTPETRTSHAIFVRARKTNSAHTGSLKAQLYEGATARSSELDTGDLTTTIDVYSLGIPDVDAEDITDYANLEVRLRGYSITGDAAVFEVADVWLDVPPATAFASLTGTAADSVSVSDVAVRAALAFGRTASDSPSISDAATRAAATRTRTAADSTTVSSSAVGAPAGVKIATDSVSVSDAATRAAATRTRTATDSVTRSDAATRISSVLKTASDTVSTSDAATRSAGARVRTAADTVTLSDVAINSGGGTKSTSVARVSLVGGGPPLTRTNHKIWVRARKTSGAHAGTIKLQLYEGATPRTTALETSALTTSFADYSVSVADADAASISSYNDLEIRFFGYSVTGTATVFEVAEVWFETPQVSHTLTAATTDNVAVSDSATFIGVRTRTASDAVGAITDAVVRARGLVKTATDSFTRSDSATRTQTQARTASDSVSRSDSAVSSTPRLRTAADSITRSDSAARSAGTRIRTAADTFTLTSTASRAARANIRQAADAITVSSTATRFLGKVKTATDTIVITSAATWIDVDPAPDVLIPTSVLLAAHNNTALIAPRRTTSSNVAARALAVTLEDSISRATVTEMMLEITLRDNTTEVDIVG